MVHAQCTAAALVSQLFWMLSLLLVQGLGFPDEDSWLRVSSPKPSRYTIYRI